MNEGFPTTRPATSAQLLAQLTGAATLAIGALLCGAGTAQAATIAPPAADGSRWALSHDGGAVAPAWSNKAAWQDRAGLFTQPQRFDARASLGADPLTGFNTDTPALQILGTSADSACMANARWEAASGGPTYHFAKSRSVAIGGFGAVSNNDTLGSLRFHGADGAAFSEAARIQTIVNGTVSSGIVPGRLQLLTANASGALTTAVNIYADQSAAFSGQILAQSGTVSAPGLSFSSNPTYGMYRISSTAIGISAGGVNAITIDNAQRCTFAAGSAAAPCICLGSDHGLYRINSTAWGASVAGVSTLQLTTGQVLFFDGTAAAPGLASITTPTTGFYRVSSDTIGVSSLGVQRYQLAADRLLLNANAAVIGAGGLTSGGPGMHVYSADGSGSGFLCTAFAAAPTNYFRRANGTGAAPTAVTASQYIGGLFCQAFDGSAYFENVRIAMLTNELQSGSAAGSRMSFQCVVNGTRTLTEAMSIYGNSINANVPLVLADAANISAGTTSGTKIGTATAQKLGFWNATPIIQPAAAAQAAAAAQGQATLTDSTGGTASTTLASITAGATYLQADLTAIKNAIASLAARLAEVKTDVANVKTLEDAIRTALVNTGLIKGAA